MQNRTIWITTGAAVLLAGAFFLAKPPVTKAAAVPLASAYVFPPVEACLPGMHDPRACANGEHVPRVCMNNVGDGSVRAAVEWVDVANSMHVLFSQPVALGPNQGTCVDLPPVADTTASGAPAPDPIAIIDVLANTDVHGGLVSALQMFNPNGSQAFVLSPTFMPQAPVPGAQLP